VTTPEDEGAGQGVALALFDGRSFFAKALLFGVQHGLLNAQKLDAMATDAPKGMVQIARYFGSEFLRPELERARDRIINLVSLHLEDESDGDLRAAAELLRDNSFMSRSKTGSDMLKALIAMPQNSHFGMNEQRGFTDEHIPQLAKWSLRPLADYKAELAKRQQVAVVLDAAQWFASELGLDAAELEDAGQDAEAVVRTALLTLAAKRTDMPDWVAFDKLITNLRKKPGAVLTLPVPKALPARFHAVVETVRQSVLADAPKLLDAAVTTRKLFNQTPAFMGRYFWLEDALAQVDDFDRSASATWNKATGGHDDDGSLLTLFLCVATGAAPKTLLSAKAAAAMVRKLRKTQAVLKNAAKTLPTESVNTYIIANAPAASQDAYQQLWAGFVDEAQTTLLSDFDYELKDALALLRRECNLVD
jgi:hypothetical protein